MWFPTIIAMITHLIFAGLICWGIDEINDDYTTYAFSGYLIGLAAVAINKHFSLLSDLIYDREALLKSIDEIYKEGR